MFAFKPALTQPMRAFLLIPWQQRRVKHKNAVILRLSDWRNWQLLDSGWRVSRLNNEKTRRETRHLGQTQSHVASWNPAWPPFSPTRCRKQALAGHLAGRSQRWGEEGFRQKGISISIICFLFFPSTVACHCFKMGPGGSDRNISGGRLWHRRSQTR